MISAFAPGRVELLGNHTDYNDGFVLSAAIHYGITVRGERNAGSDDDAISLHSETMNASAVGNLGDLQKSADQPWADYPLGVVDSFKKEAFAVSGFSAKISSDLPLGAGLSSSAALEVATATFLKKLFDLHIVPLHLAKLCRRAENEFVGVNCGLLDQISSVFGKANHAIALDCRAETVENIPFPDDVELLITHSGVKHALTGGEYNERREQCFEAARLLGERALRDVTSVRLEAARESLPLLVYKRAKHIVGENERVLQGIALLKNGDVESFGKLMTQSHESSKQNFENSTPELDALVEIAISEPGVLGSRLTGGGFGGATVSLVRKENALAISEAITEKYRAKTGNACQTYRCKIADGAH